MWVTVQYVSASTIVYICSVIVVAVRLISHCERTNKKKSRKEFSVCIHWNRKILSPRLVAFITFLLHLILGDTRSRSFAILSQLFLSVDRFQSFCLFSISPMLILCPIYKYFSHIILPHRAITNNERNTHRYNKLNASEHTVTECVCISVCELRFRTRRKIKQMQKWETETNEKETHEI